MIPPGGHPTSHRQHTLSVRAAHRLQVGGSFRIYRQVGPRRGGGLIESDGESDRSVKCLLYRCTNTLDLLESFNRGKPLRHLTLLHVVNKDLTPIYCQGIIDNMMTAAQNLAKLRETIDLIESTEDHRTRVALADSLRVTAGWQITLEVDEWRHESASWTDVGDVLGVSRQAAQQRFS